jgi:hypothetical protein
MMDLGLAPAVRGIHNTVVVFFSGSTAVGLSLRQRSGFAASTHGLKK